MQRWEYAELKIGTNHEDVFLNGQRVAKGKNFVVLTQLQQLGSEGWELVAAVSDSVTMGGILTEKWGPVRYLFKRPKP